MNGLIGRGTALFAAGAVVAVALVGCSSGGDEASDAGGDGATTSTTLVPPENFIEDPLKAEAVVNKLVNAQTPIVGLSFTQDSIGIQERGRPDTFVVFKEVAPDAFGPTTSAPDPDEKEGGEKEGEAPSAEPTERGVTVQRSEMAPEEYDALIKELDAIDKRNAGVVSEEGHAPIVEEARNEPYRFGPDRVDAWGFDGRSRVATRSASSMGGDDIPMLDSRTFSTASIDWAVFKPLMRALLDELDLGDTEAVTDVNISRMREGPPEQIVVSMSAEGERGTGNLSLEGGKMTITRG